MNTSPRQVAVRLYPRFDARSCHVSAAMIGDAHVARGGHLHIDVVPGDTGATEGQWAWPVKPALRRTIRRLLPGASREVTFPLKAIPRGSTCLRPTFVDRHGRICPTRVIHAPQLDRPEWFGSDAAIARSVPAPWTPLKVAGKSVECWGRRYAFADRSVLQQVCALDEPLLAAPVRLVIDGKAANLSPPRWLDKAKDQAVATRSAKAGDLRIDLQMLAEFDGMIRFDWSVRATKPTRVASMVMEIPVRADVAKLLFQWRGKYHCGDDRWIGRLGRPSAMSTGPNGKRLWKDFRPYIWLGDERRGIGWFAESNADWFNRDPDKAVEIAREGDAVMLRLHIISQPVNVLPGVTPPTTNRRPLEVSDLHYAFGLQATPVKPVEKDAWDYRCFCLQQQTPGADGKLRMTKRLLDRLDAAGVRTVIIFEHWTDLEAHYRTTHQRAIRKIVDACHERGMQVLLYFGFLLSNRAPEYDALADQSLIEPKTGWSIMNYPPQPVQSAWRVCLNSAWQDCVPFGIAHAMDELHVDGVYLDGTSHAFACRNLSHGCGVLHKDGSISPTYPIFAVRSAMKRIYRAVRSRQPSGQINVHNSSDMVTPSLSFATSTWDGEQFAGLKSGTAADAFLPLDTFRTEFMGHQWGVPAELLCYHGKPLNYRQAWALAILHDVPVRPMLEPDGRDLDLCAAIWRAMDTFDRKGATWSGYWDHRPIVRGERVYASVYEHPCNGKLIAVSNLDAKPQAATIRVDGREAVDALTSEKLSIRRGRITVDLGALDFMLIHVR